MVLRRSQYPGMALGKREGKEEEHREGQQPRGRCELCRGDADENADRKQERNDERIEQRNALPPERIAQGYDDVGNKTDSRQRRNPQTQNTSERQRDAHDQQSVADRNRAGSEGTSPL